MYVFFFISIFIYLFIYCLYIKNVCNFDLTNDIFLLKKIITSSKPISREKKSLGHGFKNWTELVGQTSSTGNRAPIQFSKTPKISQN